MVCGKQGTSLPDNLALVHELLSLVLAA
jgi:hypothetical protein